MGTLQEIKIYSDTPPPIIERRGDYKKIRQIHELLTQTLLFPFALNAWFAKVVGGPKQDKDEYVVSTKFLK